MVRLSVKPSSIVQNYVSHYLALFLSGQDFDRSGQLWQRFQTARELRDRWTHPKPPFDTWSLTLADVHAAITAVREMLIKLAEMMDAEPPLWLRPVDEVPSLITATPENAG